MSIEDMAPVLLEMRATICKAEDAEEAWMQVIAIGERAGEKIPNDLRTASAKIATLHVVRQLSGLFQRSPLPPDLTFLYFGLFDGLTASGEEVPGFYVSGGVGGGANPTVNGPDDLTYFPDERFLDSPLLGRVKAEGLPGGEDYFFDYALTFAAAAILAKFAIRALHLDKSLLVGFDSGDILLVT